MKLPVFVAVFLLFCAAPGTNAQSHPDVRLHEKPRDLIDAFIRAEERGDETTQHFLVTHHEPPQIPINALLFLEMRRTLDKGAKSPELHEDVQYLQIARRFLEFVDNPVPRTRLLQHIDLVEELDEAYMTRQAELYERYRDIVNLRLRGRYQAALTILRKIGYDPKREPISIQGSNLLLQKQMCLYALSRKREAGILSLELASVSTQLGWPDLKHRSLTGAGLCFDEAGDLRAALDAYKQNLAHVRAMGQPHLLPAALFLCGTGFMKIGFYEEGLYYCEQARAAAKEIGDNETLVLATSDIGMCHQFLGNLDLASGFVKSAKEQFTEMGRDLDSIRMTLRLADIERFRGKVHKSLSMLEEIKATLPEDADHQHAILSNAFGSISMTLNEPEKALEYFTTALELMTQVNNVRGRHASLLNLTLAHLELNDPETAFDYLQGLLPALEESGNLSRLNLAMYYESMAHQLQGRPDKARQILEKVIEQGAALRLPRSEARGHLALAGLEEREGNQGKASASYQKTLVTLGSARDKRALSPAAPRWARLSIRLGNSLAAKSRLQEMKKEHPGDVVGARKIEALLAVAELNLALQKPKKTIKACNQLFLEFKDKDTKPDRMAMSIANRLLGDAHRQLSNHDGSIASLHKALIEQKDLGIIRQQALTLESFGRTYSNEGKLDLAYDFTRRSLKLLEPSKHALDRARIQSFLARISLKLDRTEESIQASYAAGQEYIEASLGLQMDQAFALREMARASVDTGLDAVYRHFQDQPHAPRNIMTQALWLLDAGRALLLADQIQQPAPPSDSRFKRFVRKPQPVDIGTFQGLVPANTAWVLYHKTETQWLAFVIRRDGYSLHSLGALSSIPVDNHRHLASAWDTDSLDRNEVALAERLHDLFMRPLESELNGITKLVISPDAELYEYPFDAMVSSKWHEEKSADPERLIERFEISFCESPSVYLSTRNREDRWTVTDSRKLPSLLVEGPSLGETAKRGAIRGNDHPTLRHGARESRTVARYARKCTESNILTRSRATRSEFLQRLTGGSSPWRRVHIITHYSFRPQHPGESGLHLRDGIVSRTDIDKTTFKSLTVVLSACETGRGHLVQGEGNWSLARAFREAGASRVIASHWKVNDKSTANLFDAYYQKVEEEQHPPAQALREAKLEMLRRGGKHATPHHWAGFVLWGLPD